MPSKTTLQAPVSALRARQSGKQAGQVEGAGLNGVDGKPGIDQRKLMLRHRIERPVQPREVASHPIDQFLECHVEPRLARRPPPVEQILHGEQALSGAGGADDGGQPAFRQTSVRDLIEAGNAGRLLADFARADAASTFGGFNTRLADFLIIMASAPCEHRLFVCLRG